MHGDLIYYSLLYGMNSVYFHNAKLCSFSILFFVHQGGTRLCRLGFKIANRIKKLQLLPTLLLLSDGGIPSSISAVGVVGGSMGFQPDRLLTKLPEVARRPTSPPCPSLCLAGSFSTWGRSSSSSSSSSSSI